MNGWSELGAILGGGKQLRQQAYDTGITQGARQADLLEQARARRDQNLGLQAITPEAVSAAQANPGTAAELVSAMFHAKVDPRQLSGYQLQQSQLGGLNGTDAAAQALGYTPEQAAAIGTLVRANGGKNVDQSILGAMRLQEPMASTAAVPQDKNDLLNAMGLKTTGITNGVAFNPYGTPEQTINATPVGRADIGLKGAQANAANAHARLFDTQTAAGGFNSRTGQGNGVAPPIAQPGLPTGPDYLKTLDPSDARIVQALDSGRLAFPTGTALKSPYWQTKMMQVAQLDPNFDTTNYNSRNATLKAFKGAGTNAQQINALNTFAKHVELLGQNFDQLHNTPVPLVNGIVNSVGSSLGLKDNVGAYNQNAMNTAMELESLWKKGAGNEADIARAMANLSSASSPAQFKNAQQTLIKLAHGKLAALRDQYIQGMGGTHNAMQFLDPETQAIFSRIDPTSTQQYAADANAPAGADIASQGSTAPATGVPAARAIDPKTGHAVVWNGSAWVPEQ